MLVNRLLICGLILISAAPVFGQNPVINGVPESEWETFNRAAIDLKFAIDSKEIVDWSTANNLASESEKAWRTLLVRDPARQYIFLPDSFEKPAAASSSGMNAEWRAKLDAAKLQYASSLFELALIEAKNGAGDTAYQLLHEVLYWVPDFEKARLALGHRRTDSGWEAYSERLNSRDAPKAHPELNWPAASYLLVTTENFEIASQADPETTKFLAEQLQRWHRVWRQVFFEYWSSPTAVKSWIEGKSKPRPQSKKFRVVFFRDREQYVQELGKFVDGVAASTGYYDDKTRIAFFYASNVEADIESWRHELTHQLFQESIRTRNAPFADEHLWLGEGIAMYMESLKDFGGFATLGGFDSRRLQYARLRKLRDKFYVPFDELSAFSLSRFQLHPNVRNLYSQSAGLAQFLMTANSGAYRNGVIEFLRLTYTDKTKPGAFAKCTNLQPAEIDSRYAEFLKSDSATVGSYLIAPASVTELALIDANLDDSAFAAVGTCTRLQWLDVSGSELSAGRIASLANCLELTQLFACRCRLGEKSLVEIGNLASLEEIDLSECEFNETELGSLASLPSLRTISLTNCSLSDAALSSLAIFPALNTVDLTGAVVSPTTLRKLELAKPQLLIRR